MAITIQKEISSFVELYDNSWSGALETLREIESQGREDEAMQIIEEYMNDCSAEIPTDTAINDFIWFDLADIMGLYEEEAEEA